MRRYPFIGDVFGGGFKFDNPYGSQKRFRTGTKTFRLTSNELNSLTGDIFTSAEADYTAKGLQQTVQGQIVSTREAKFVKAVESESTVINRIGSKKTTSKEIIERRPPPAPAPARPSARPTPFPGTGGGPGYKPPTIGPGYRPGNPDIGKKEGFPAYVNPNEETGGNKAKPAPATVSPGGGNSRRHHGTRQTKPVVARPKQTVKPRSYGPPRRGSRGGVRIYSA